MKTPFLKEPRARALDEIRKSAKGRLFGDQALERLLAIEQPTLGAIFSTKGISKKVAEGFGREILSALKLEPEYEDRVYTVSEFLDYLNGRIADKFVFVEGEIAEYKIHPAGAFFCLKDKSDGSILRAYMRPRYLSAIGGGAVLEDGMEVRVGGSANIYKPRGSLSIDVEEIVPIGEGALRKMYELLKKKLEEEGLFRRKRPIPEFISSIGVITSVSGEVIHDFRKNLKPLGFKVGIRDARVQGVKAEVEIAQAIRHFNSAKKRPDVLVVMRGGGSFEDLAAFNGEPVARAIFGSEIPVICAVGHDRDVPIANLTADISVSTPSMAAVYVNNSWNPIFENLPLFSGSILSGFESLLSSESGEIKHFAAAMKNAVRRIFDKYARARHFLFQEARRMEEKLKTLDSQKNFLRRGILQKSGEAIAKLNGKLVRMEEYLRISDPLNNLKLGYGIIRDARGKILKSVKGANKGDTIKVRLRDGELESKITKINEK